MSYQVLHIYKGAAVKMLVFTNRPLPYIIKG